MQVGPWACRAVREGEGKADLDMQSWGGGGGSKIIRTWGVPIRR